MTPDEILLTAHRGGRLTREEWKAVEMAESKAGAEVLRQWREMLRLGLRAANVREPFASETADFLIGWCAQRILFGQVSPGRPAGDLTPSSELIADVALWPEGRAEVERLQAIEHAARDVDGLWYGADGELIHWSVEAAEALEDLRTVLAAPSACPCGALHGEEHEHRDAEPVA